MLPCVWKMCVACVFCRDYANCLTMWQITRARRRTPPPGCFTQARISGGERRVIGKNKSRDGVWAHLQIYTLTVAHAHTKADNMTRNSAQGSRHFQFAASPSPDKSVIWEFESTCAGDEKKQKHFHGAKRPTIRQMRWHCLIRCRFRRQRTRIEITVRSSGNPNCMRHFADSSGSLLPQ